MVSRNSEILRKDRDGILLISKRMTPEQRVVAFFNHSQFVNQIYLAGLDYRAKAERLAAKRKTRQKS